MILEVEEFGSVKIIKVIGEVKTMDSEEIKKEIQHMMINEQKRIIINLKEAPMIYSTGIGVLFNIIKKCEEKEISVKFSNISENIIRILEMIKLIEYFDIYENDEKAIESF